VEAPEVLARVAAGRAGIAVVLAAVRNALLMLVLPRPARADHGRSA
jgi:hypothetical protein